MYVLELENKKFYIGLSNNVEKRFQEHLEKKDCLFTKLYSPIKIIEKIETKDPFDEDKYVKIYMQKFGIENVRGGSYSNVELMNYQKKMLTLEINNATFKCFRCGQRGHKLKNCKFTYVL